MADPWPAISESAKDLIRKMLVRNPEKRYTAHQVLCNQTVFYYCLPYSHIFLILNWCENVYLGHPWIREDGVAPDKPIDSAVLTRMKQFMAMNKIKKIALRVRVNVDYTSLCPFSYK